MTSKINGNIVFRLQWVFLIFAIVSFYTYKEYFFQLHFVENNLQLNMILAYSALLLLISFYLRTKAGEKKIPIKVYLIIAIIMFWIEMIPTV